MRSGSACHVTLLWAARPAIDKALFPGRERSNAMPGPGPVLQFQEVYDTYNKSRQELVSRKYSVNCVYLSIYIYNIYRRIYK